MLRGPGGGCGPWREHTPCNLSRLLVPPRVPLGTYNVLTARPMVPGWLRATVGSGAPGTLAGRTGLRWGINAGYGDAGGGRGSASPFRRLWCARHRCVPSSVTGGREAVWQPPSPPASHLLYSIAQFIQLHRAGRVTQQPSRSKGEVGVDSSLDSDRQSPPETPI